MSFGSPSHPPDGSQAQATTGFDALKIVVPSVFAQSTTTQNPFLTVNQGPLFGTGNTQNPFLPTNLGGTANTQNPFLPANLGGTANTQNPFLPVNLGGTANAQNPFLPANLGGTANTQNPFLTVNQGETANTQNPFLTANQGGTANAQNPFLTVNQGPHFGTANTLNMASQSQQASPFGVLGQQQQQAQPSSLFGGSSQQPQTSMFGGSSQQPQTSLFGGSTQQQQPPQTSIFGGSAQQQQPSQTNIFGGSNQQQQPPQTNMFAGIGQQQQNPQPSPFSFLSDPKQQPQQSSIFGTSQQQQQQQPQQSSIFGTSNQQQQQQQPKPDMFAGLWGNTNQTQQQPQQTVLNGQFPQSISQNAQQQGQQQGSGIPLPQTRVWQQIDPSPHTRPVTAQMEAAFLKWNPDSSSTLFQTYLYNYVSPDQAPFYSPGPQDDEAKWEEALRKKPAPGAIPVLVKGFEQLSRRVLLQHHHLKILQGRLHEIDGGLRDLLKKHDLQISIRAAECKRKHLRLNHQCLLLAGKVQVLRNRGYSMDSAEEELREKMLKLERSVFDPALNGRGEEIWARMVSLRERSRQLQRESEKVGKSMGEGQVEEIDEEVMRRARKILEDYGSQISHLTKELSQIGKDFAEWEQPTMGGQGIGR